MGRARTRFEVAEHGELGRLRGRKRLDVPGGLERPAGGGTRGIHADAGIESGELELLRFAGVGAARRSR